jgi:putative membrane protein
MALIIRLLVNAIALLLVAHFVPGVALTHGFGGAIIAALVLGIVNAVIKPILIILSLPVEIITLGLFTFVINALLFYFVGKLHVGYVVDSFGAAFIGALVLTIVSFLLSSLVAVAERA